MAREKKVFTNYTDVARLWANQSQQSAEYTGGKMYFNGNTIYSYGSHFQIAKHVTNETGEHGILFTLDTYSNTTRDHCWVVRQAVSSRNIIYCKSPDSSHEQNVKFFTDNMEELMGQIRKKTNRKFESRLQVLRTNADRLKKYIEFFGVDIPFETQVMLSFVEAGDVVNRLRNQSKSRLTTCD